jgi:HEAT repeat protein
VITRPLGLGPSEEDGARIECVEAFARSGTQGIPPLVALLVDRSWVVRRAVVTALAGAGDPAVSALSDVLSTMRDDEARLAAAVDALVASRGDVEPTLLRLLETETAPAVLCDAIQVLGRRKSEVAAPALRRMADHADDNVAVAALEALGRLSTTGSIDSLIATIEKRNFFRTFPAIDVLAKTRHPRAVAPLVALLAVPEYAAEAIRVLGTTGQLSAAAPLATLLAAADDATVRIAASAIDELAAVIDARMGEQGAVGRIVAGIATSGTAHRLIAAMNGADDEEQNRLVVVLGFVDDVHVVDLLDAGTSARRLRILSLLERPRAHVAAIAACLTDHDPAVRALACDVLARAGEPAASPALFTLLGDADARVAQSAAGAIQSLGSDQTKTLVLEAAVSTDARVRRNALRILAYFGYPEGFELLVRAMSADDLRIREAAIQGLAFLDDARAIAALFDTSAHESPRMRAAVMRALGHTDAASAGTVLRAALGDGDPWVRYYACQSLAKLGVEGAEDDVIRMLEDPAGQVRLAAVEGLARFPGARAGLALEGLAGSSDEDMRRAAIVGLGILGRDEAMPLLQTAAAEGDPATRLVAIAALAELGHRDVVPTLARAAADVDENVQRSALALLARRSGYAATEAILQLLGRPHLQGAVVDALGTFSEGRVEAILAALEVADLAAAQLLVAALVRLQRGEPGFVLLAVLDFENPHARCAVVGALAGIDTPETRAALARVASSDPDAEVRRVAEEGRMT